MFQRILLALDSGDAGTVASSFTIALARANSATVHVVHVDEYFFGGRGLAGGRGLTTDGATEGAAMVAAALEEMQAAGIIASGVSYRTTRFDTPRAIADVAEEWRAEVVVLGSRRRRGLWFLRRAMRERVARATALPVLTAPAPLRVVTSERTFKPVPAAADVTIG